MFNFLKKLFGKRSKSARIDLNLKTGKSALVSETEEGKLFTIVGMRDTCPDCLHHGFYGGPRGGMSQNIFCMNRDCRSGFNITYFSNTEGVCERIGKGDLERYPKE